MCMRTQDNMTFTLSSIPNTIVQMYVLPLLFFQAQCIMNISDYIKKNPNASDADKAKEIQKHVEIFKKQIELL